MATNNAINDFIGVSTGTSLNLGSSTTINGAINDGTLATSSATTLATSLSIKTYIASIYRQVQTSATQSGTVSSSGATIPYDDTIPQVSEGGVYLGLNITPKHTSNKLLINAVAYGSLSTSDTITIGIFQDSVANAIACTSFTVAAGGVVTIPLTYFGNAPSTSSISYTVRAGGNSGTFTLNGVATARKLGGSYVSSLIVYEFGSQ